jgi:hypothetical protein
LAEPETQKQAGVAFPITAITRDDGDNGDPF